MENLRVLKKPIFLWILSLLMLAAAIGYYITSKSSSTVSWGADHTIYYSIEELEKDSDLIVIGSPTSSDNFLVTSEENYVHEGYTKTKLDINQVVYSNNPSLTKDIIVIEPYFTYDFNLKQKLVTQTSSQLITYENYTPMKKSQNYILFLKLNEDRDMYLINGLYQGQYLIQPSDFINKNVALDKETQGHETNLASQVFDKYLSKIDNINR